MIMQSFLKMLLAATICAHLSEPRFEYFVYELVVDKRDFVDLNLIIFSKYELRILISFLSVSYTHLRAHETQ